MATASNALDVKEAIFTQLKAIGTDWDVTWGYTKSPGKTFVYLGQIEWESSEWVTNRSRREIFNVKVVMDFRRARGNPEKVEREVMAMGREIEEWVTNSPNLGIPSVIACGFVPKRMDSFPSDQDAEAQFEADIRVTARFTRTA